MAGCRSSLRCIQRSDESYCKIKIKGATV
jgi:hypothetical protein